MTTNDRTKLLERIQRLMGMANVDNEHEAAQMAAKAAELIAKHNVQQHELELKTGKKAEEVVMRSIAWPVHTTSTVTRTDPQTKRKVKVTIIDSQDQWEYTLAGNIAWGFFCQVVWDKTYLTFIGRETDAMIAEHTWSVVRGYLVDLVRPRVSAARREDPGLNPKKWRRDWLAGAAVGVYWKLYDRRKELEQGGNTGGGGSGAQKAAQAATADATSTAMVLMREDREAEVGEYVKQKFERLDVHKPREIRRQEEAYRDGYHAGREVPMDPALTKVDHDGLTDSEPDRRRAELLTYSPTKLWDVVMAKLMRTDTPPLEATVYDLVEWIVEAEYYDLHIHRV
jgi:hypothetical protein